MHLQDNQALGLTFRSIYQLGIRSPISFALRLGSPQGGKKAAADQKPQLDSEISTRTAQSKLEFWVTSESEMIFGTPPEII